jgi:hypothetical protein
LTFLPGSAYTDALLFAGIIWGLAAACALVTVSARPEGAAVAALIGAAGASARSPQMRSLLWLWENDLAGLYGMLVLEVLLLCAVMLVAAAIVDLVRRAVACLKPNWLWQPPIARTSNGKQDRAVPGRNLSARDSPEAYAATRRELILYLLAAKLRTRSGAKPAPGASRAALRQSLSCLCLGLVLAVVLLLLLTRSPERGQILFGLLAAFLVASVVAHQVFPTPHSVVIWGMPMIVAVGLYALAAFSARQGVNPWISLDNYARALPADWLTVGCGGALVGYWISERIHELRHIERTEAK